MVAQFLIVPTQAINHWQRVVEIQPDNGDVWSAMGHCFLMQDDLQKAYMAYQQALYFLPNPKVRAKSIEATLSVPADACHAIFVIFSPRFRSSVADHPHQRKIGMDWTCRRFPHGSTSFLSAPNLASGARECESSIDPLHISSMSLFSPAPIRHSIRDSILFRLWASCPPFNSFS